MSGAQTSAMSARLLTPDYLVRGQDNAISCPLWQSGVLVAPTQSGSTVSVYDSSNTAVVNGAPVVVTGSIATYTIPSASLPTTLSFGMGWRIEWSLVVSGAVAGYRNSAGLVRSQLAPVVTDLDLFRRESSLNPDGTAPISTLSNFQDYIDEAWVTIHGKLTGRGSLPHLIMEPTALREPHLLFTLHLIFEDFRTRLSEAWGEKAKDYAKKFESAWQELRFEYDTTSSGQSDGRRKRAAGATVWTCGRD